MAAPHGSGMLLGSYSGVLDPGLSMHAVHQALAYAGDRPLSPNFSSRRGNCRHGRHPTHQLGLRVRRPATHARYLPRRKTSSRHRWLPAPAVRHPGPLTVKTSTEEQARLIGCCAGSASTTSGTRILRLYAPHLARWPDGASRSHDCNPQIDSLTEQTRSEPDRERCKAPCIVLPHHPMAAFPSI
jgi:hypothetical protein